MDVKLFLRHGRSIALTETGRELYNLTRQQFDAEQEAEALLSRKIRGPNRSSPNGSSELGVGC